MGKNPSDAGMEDPIDACFKVIKPVLGDAAANANLDTLSMVVSTESELFFRSHIHVHVHAAVVVVNAPALAPLLKDPLVLCKKIRKRGSS